MACNWSESDPYCAATCFLASSALLWKAHSFVLAVSRAAASSPCFWTSVFWVLVIPVRAACKFTSE